MHWRAIMIRQTKKGIEKMTKTKIHKMKYASARKAKNARRDFETGIDWNNIAGELFTLTIESDSENKESK